MADTSRTALKLARLSPVPHPVPPPFPVPQEAGIPAKLAPTIGIAVDHRRTNRSLESLQASAGAGGGEWVCVGGWVRGGEGLPWRCNADSAASCPAGTPPGSHVAALPSGVRWRAAGLPLHRACQLRRPSLRRLSRHSPALPPPLQENANRLKAYKANLVVFPRRAGKPKAGDASAAELGTAQVRRRPALLPCHAPAMGRPCWACHGLCATAAQHHKRSAAPASACGAAPWGSPAVQRCPDCHSQPATHSLLLRALRPPAFPLVQQLKGALLPFVPTAAAVEKVAVTADMKVGCWGCSTGWMAQTGRGG